MKIELQKVDAYMVQTSKGAVMFEKVSAWNGMMELKDKQGRKLIVIPSEADGSFGEVFRQAFGNIFADGSGKQGAQIVMASPELFEELKLSK